MSSNDELINEIEALDSRLQITNTKLDTLDTTMSTVDTSVNTLGTKLDTLDTTMNTVDTSVNTLDTSINDMKTTLDSRLTTTNTKLDTLNTTMTTVDTDINTLGTKLDTLDTTMNTVNTSVNTLDTSINDMNTALDSRLAITNTKLDTLNTTMTTVDTDINTLGTKLDTLDTTMNTVDTSVGTLDTSVNSLKTSVDTLSSRYVEPQNSALAVQGRTSVFRIEPFNYYIKESLNATDEYAAGPIAFDGTTFYAVTNWNAGSNAALVSFTKTGIFANIDSAFSTDLTGLAYDRTNSKLFGKTLTELVEIDTNDGSETRTAFTDTANGFTTAYAIAYDPDSTKIWVVYEDGSSVYRYGTLNTSTAVITSKQQVTTDISSAVGAVFFRGILWIFAGWTYGFIIQSGDTVDFNITASDQGFLGDSTYDLTTHSIYSFSSSNTGLVLYEGSIVSVQRVSINDDGGGSITVDATSWPLPTGASTSAKQDTMITALQLIDDLRTTLATVAGDQLRVDIISDSAGISTTANQTTMITALQLIDDLRNALSVVASDQLRVDIISDSAGLATTANQATMITALQLIDDLRNALGSVATDTLRISDAGGSITVDGTVTAVQTKSTGITYNTVNIDAAAAQIVASNSNREAVEIYNADTVRILYIGDDNAVTTANGRPVYPLCAVGLDGYTGAVFGIADGAGCDVRYSELT